MLDSGFGDEDHVSGFEFDEFDLFRMALSRSKVKGNDFVFASDGDLARVGQFGETLGGADGLHDVHALFGGKHHDALFDDLADHGDRPLAVFTHGHDHLRIGEVVFSQQILQVFHQFRGGLALDLYILQIGQRDRTGGGDTLFDLVPIFLADDGHHDLVGWGKAIVFARVIESK